MICIRKMNIKDSKKNQYVFIAGETLNCDGAGFLRADIHPDIPQGAGTP